MDTDLNPKAKEKKTVGPSTTSAYLDPYYWDERFTTEEHYEWLKDYSHFRHLVQAHIKSNSSVLELGCGNSWLSEELYNDGITEITCIDLPPVAVERMQERLWWKGYKEIKVLEADMLDLPFSNECFDVVIEKGTMEVLFVNSGDPWNPRPETVTKVMVMLEVLVICTCYSHTFGVLSLMLRSLRGLLSDGFHYFFYILQKGKGSSSDKELCNRHAEPSIPSISMFHEELEGEDYIFRTTLMTWIDRTA